jgi:hypothetical protein
MSTGPQGFTLDDDRVDACCSDAGLAVAIVLLSNPDFSVRVHGNVARMQRTAYEARKAPEQEHPRTNDSLYNHSARHLRLAQTSFRVADWNLLHVRALETEKQLGQKCVPVGPNLLESSTFEDVDTIRSETTSPCGRVVNCLAT